MGFWDIFKPKDDVPAEFNEDELLFYRELKTKLKLANIKKKLSYNILSDKTIVFKLDGIGIGRVKIRSKIKRIQLLKKAPNHNIDVLWLDVAGVDDLIMFIDKWIEYIKS
jgi:hypothetical protein